ncbi:hypothetical protein IWZ01DRAFT_261148 [Phyllosticta capitalensis]
MAESVPSSVLGLAIFVNVLGGLAIIIGLIFTLILWIRGERSSHIMLLSATCVLSSIVNFIRHLDYTLNWRSIMIERWRESHQPGRLALDLIGTTACGWRLAVDYLRLYFYDVESLIVASWAAALLIDSYNLKIKTETKETFFIASRMCAPILPAIVVAIYCSSAVENNLPAYLVLTNIIRVISLALGSAMVLAVLYKYLTITRGFGNSKASPPTQQTPRSSVASRKRKSLMHAGLSLAIRFAMIMMILLIFEASVIAMQMVGYYHTLRTGGLSAGPDLTAHTAQIELGVGIPGLMPSILLAFVFGTTTTFRDQYGRMIRECFARHYTKKETDDDVECIVMEPPKPTGAMQSQCSKTIANLKGLPELDFPKPTEAMQSQCSKTIAFLRDSQIEPPKPTEAMQTQCTKTIAFLRGEQPPIEPPKPTEAMQSQCSKTIAFLRGEPEPRIEPPKPTEAMKTQCSKTIAFLRGEPEPKIEPPKPTEAMQTQCSKTIAFLRGEPEPKIQPPKPTEAMQTQCSKTIAFLRGEPEPKIEPPKPTEAMQQQCSKTIAFLKGEETATQTTKPTEAKADFLKTSERPVTAVRLSKVSPVVIDVPPNARRSSERRSSRVVSFSEPSPESPRLSTHLSGCKGHDCQSGLCEESRNSQQLRRDTLAHIENCMSKSPTSPPPGFPPRTTSLASERSWGSTHVHRGPPEHIYTQYRGAPVSPGPLTPASYRTFASDERTLTSSSPATDKFSPFDNTPQTPSGPRPAYTVNRPTSMHWSSKALVDRPQDSPSLSPRQLQQQQQQQQQQQPQPRPRSRPQSTTNPFLAPFMQISAGSGHERRPSMPAQVPSLAPPQPAVNPAGTRSSWHERRSTEPAPSWPLRDDMPAGDFGVPRSRQS